VISPAYPALGLPVVDLLADQLVKVGADGPTPGLRHSSIWRPAIEKDHSGDGRDLLLSALRDAAVGVAAVDGVTGVVELLDRYESAVFTRLLCTCFRRFPIRTSSSSG
jgi:hypothetical protein